MLWITGFDSPNWPCILQWSAINTHMKDKFSKIGKKGYVFAGGMEVLVTVTDYKNSYGRDRWQVEPVSGNGSVWIESIKFID